MADEKKYLDSSGLIRLVANVIAKLNGKADSSHNHDDKYSKTDHTHDDRYYTEDEVDEKISGITSGTIVVKEAEHAESADTATSATTATNANHAVSADTATSATSATTATSADSATKDGNGKVIADTYQTIANATSQHNALQSSIDGKVPTSRTINGKALTANITLSASDVSAYSKSEIDSKVSTINSAISGKEASGTAASAVSTHNTSTSAHNDIRLLIEDLTTRLNTLANSTDEDLDQMAEIVAYIKSNKSLIDSVTTSKVNVADIVNNLTTNVTNKPLSAAQGVAIKTLIDALQAEVDANESSISKLQTKVNGIEEGAQVNVNPDWNQNDPNEDSYIANRPFYTEVLGETTIVDNATFETVNNDGVIGAEDPFALTLEEGSEYTVTWNGTEYSTVCSIIEEVLFIGNLGFYGGENTGEPFLIGCANGMCIVLSSEVGTHTISIVNTSVKIHKIDNRYIEFPEGASIGVKGEGDYAEVFNDYYSNVASGMNSHAEGSGTTASGMNSHAEGSCTTASGWSSHAEGSSTTASREYSHAEGSNTTASGINSHAEGCGTTASGWSSHAEGYCTIAASEYQHAQGKYNVEDKNDTYAHIVGNGSYSKRSNAHTIDWDGNAWYAGTIKLGGTSYNDASEVALKSDFESLETSIDEKIGNHNHDDRYYTESEIDSKVETINTAISGKADVTHTHAIADITDLQSTLDGKAASSHNHSASNITSGTLGVARGGTGKATHTTNAILTGNGTSAVNNVATASGAFYATAANGAAKFGTLPIAQGGTGSTSASAARTALGITPANIGAATQTAFDELSATVSSQATTITSLTNRIAALEALVVSISNTEIDSVCGS